MQWRKFLLLAILMALSTGGSFTCYYHSGDDATGIHPPPTTRP